MYAEFKNFYHFNLLSVDSANTQWTSQNHHFVLPLFSEFGPEDVIDGTPGNDVLNGTANGDTISGFAGDDTLNGLGGNDTLIGGTGNDQVNGGTGDDMLIVGVGDNNILDIYRGGSGTDTLVNNSGIALAFDDFSIASSNNGNSIEFIDMNLQQITGTTGVDSLTFTSVTLQDLGAGVHIDMLAGNDSLTGSNLQSLTYDLGDGNDAFSSSTTSFAHTVDGGAGNDVINGNNGADILTGGAGIDQVNGNSGDDTLIIGAGDHDVGDIYRGGSGIDTLVNNAMMISQFPAHLMGTVSNLSI